MCKKEVTTVYKKTVTNITFYTHTILLLVISNTDKQTVAVINCKCFCQTLRYKIKSSRILTITLETFLNKLFRSSCPEVFSKRGVPENFAKFTEKHLCQNLFLNKVAGSGMKIYLKKGLWCWCVTMNFAKCSRTRFSNEHLWTTPSGYSRTLSHGYLSIIL